MPPFGPDETSSAPRHETLTLALKGRRPVQLRGERLLSLREGEGDFALSLDLYLTPQDRLTIVLTRHAGQALPLALAIFEAGTAQEAVEILQALDPAAAEPLGEALLEAAPLADILAAHAELATRMDRARRMFAALSETAFGVSLRQAA